MTHTHFFGTALIAFTLFATPMISSADDLSLAAQPPPADTDSQPIAVVHSGDAKKEDAYSLASKRAHSPEPAEGVDCFYEENKAEKDCRRDKSSTR